MLDGHGWGELVVGRSSYDSGSSMTNDRLIRELGLTFELFSTIVDTLGVDCFLDCTLDWAIVVSGCSPSEEKWELEVDCLSEGDAVAVRKFPK